MHDLCLTLMAHQNITTSKSLVLWKMVVDAVLSEPISAPFPCFTGKEQGKTSIMGRFGVFLVNPVRNQPTKTVRYRPFPCCSVNREKIFLEQGKKNKEQARETGEQGRPKPASFTIALAIIFRALKAPWHKSSHWCLLQRMTASSPERTCATEYSSRSGHVQTRAYRRGRLFTAPRALHQSPVL